MTDECSGLVLGSGSPRRRDLLEEWGYRFRVIPPDVEEWEDPSIDIRELTTENARLKARAVAIREPGAAIVAADTLVLLDDEVLGKPSDRTEAMRMLQRLNGRTHQVFTAVCLVHAETGRSIDLQVTTSVVFRNLDDAQLADYHERIDPLDKAGAYAAQEHGERIIERIEGSMTNVIGLPMDEVAATLESEFAIRPRP